MSLYTVVYLELSFIHRKWNIFDTRKRKNGEKYNTSYLHNESGPLLYEAIECQQCTASASAGQNFSSFLVKSLQRLLQLCFLSKDDTLSNEPHFLPTSKKKKFDNSSDKIRQ